MTRRCGVALMVLVPGVRVGSGRAGDEAAVAERLARMRETPSAAGPWAVSGDRMVERALKELGLPKRAFTPEVVHGDGMMIDHRRSRAPPESVRAGRARFRHPVVPARGPSAARG